MKVLVVEDHPEMAKSIREGLQENGMTVEVCDDGDSGLKRAQTEVFDAIVLDIMLPGLDGLAVLQSLKGSGARAPIILVTARGAIDDRVKGLDLGADDYLTKPFYMEELIARLRALTRRATGQSSSLRQVGSLTMNLVTREVRYQDSPVDLSPREFSLIEFLTRTPGHVYTRAQILEHVWSCYFDPHSNIVDVHIQKLRGKLNDRDREAIIETVRGVGYRIRETTTGGGQL